MINKAVGYSAFRTYGELPYPTRKQGKQLELANKVWESTFRSIDQANPLGNFNNGKTVYKQNHVQNTNPIDYHPEHVAKGTGKTLNFQKSGTIKAYDRQQAAKYGKTNPITDPNNPKYDQRKNKFLATGTQHWKSVYSQANQSSMRYQSNNKNKTSQNDFERFSATNTNMNDGNGNTTQNQFKSATMRSNSLGGKSLQQQAEELGKAKSYKNRPYINNSKMQITDYKFNYGEKIGSTPLDLMGRVSYQQPLRDHPLKRGTNQLWTEIPNYQGFKPSELSFKDYKTKIQNRKQQNKGNLKLQVSDNFLVQVPGYGGFKPQFQKTATNLRDSCLSTKVGGAN